MEKILSTENLAKIVEELRDRQAIQDLLATKTKGTGVELF